MAAIKACNCSKFVALAFGELMSQFDISLKWVVTGGAKSGLIVMKIYWELR
jgi:hypothetical protein